MLTEDCLLHSHAMSPLSSPTRQAQLNSILQAALQGADLTIDQGVFLLEQQDAEAIAAIQQAADQLRQQLVGETVTYIVNRNINFTNICEQHCSFCAFRRDSGDDGAYWLNWATMREKTAEAVSVGATEICMQGGLHPDAKIDGQSLHYYLKLIRTIKEDFPHIHLHAFSPQEIEFIAREDHLTFEQVITALRDAGLGSMPGTAAEVLDDDVRKILCPEKISASIWLEIVETAHRLGLPTTSTLMAGHIETPRQQIEHLAKLRQLQQTAAEKGYPTSISEFIILSFVGEQAPKPLRRRVGHDQPILEDALLLTAVSRLFLGKWIKNHQPSWVKLGLNGATEALRWGCNDIGGTLMEEHITSMAGAKGGTCKTPEDLKGAIASLHRPFAQRDTLYRHLSSPD